MQKMIGQASIPQGAVATLQAPIEPGFQSSAGHGYALVADLFLLTTIALLQSLAATGLVSDAETLLPAPPQQNHFSDSLAADGPGSFGAGHAQIDDRRPCRPAPENGQSLRPVSGLLVQIRAKAESHKPGLGEC